MECERVREEFVERLTGNLDAERSRAIDDHVAGCTECRAETERMREMWAQLGTLRVPETGAAAGRVGRLIDGRVRGGALLAGSTGSRARVTGRVLI
jgi:predicted anti-sigma-YlaC factor YlaD